MQTKIRTVLFFAGIFITAIVTASAQEPWSTNKANAWYDQHHWMVGCNFTPSTAISPIASAERRATMRELGLDARSGSD